MADRPLSPADLWQAATASRQTSHSTIDGEADSTTGGVPNKISSKNPQRAYAKLAWKEAKGKFVWCVVVLLMRICFGAIKHVASASDDTSFDVPGTTMSCELMGYTLEIPLVVLKAAATGTALLSSAASLLVLVLPDELFKPSRIGILAAFPPLLHLIKSDFYLSDLPLAPIRVSQCVMGKLTPRQLLVILPVYFVTTLLATATVRFVIPARFLFGGLDPIRYGDNHTDGTLDDLLEWAMHFAKEVLVNAMAVIGLRILPELLRLNRVGNAEIWCILIIWPLSRIVVDVSGSASSFAPELVYALKCVRHWDPSAIVTDEDAIMETVSRGFQLARSAHRLGPIIGGFVAGKIMLAYFP